MWGITWAQAGLKAGCVAAVLRDFKFINVIISFWKDQIHCEGTAVVTGHAARKRNQITAARQSCNNFKVMNGENLKMRWRLAVALSVRGTGK